MSQRARVQTMCLTFSKLTLGRLMSQDWAICRHWRVTALRQQV